MSLETKVGGSGEQEESVVLQNLHIVGAEWDDDTSRIQELKPHSETINRLNSDRGIKGNAW